MRSESKAFAVWDAWVSFCIPSPKAGGKLVIRDQSQVKCLDLLPVKAP